MEGCNPTAQHGCNSSCRPLPSKFGAFDVVRSSSGSCATCPRRSRLSPQTLRQNSSMKVSQPETKMMKRMKILAGEQPLTSVAEVHQHPAAKQLLRSCSQQLLSWPDPSNFAMASRDDQSRFRGVERMFHKLASKLQHKTFINFSTSTNWRGYWYYSFHVHVKILDAHMFTIQIPLSSWKPGRKARCNDYKQFVREVVYPQECGKNRNPTTSVHVCAFPSVFDFCSVMLCFLNILAWPHRRPGKELWSNSAWIWRYMIHLVSFNFSSGPFMQISRTSQP